MNPIPICLCDEFSFRWNYRKTNDGERTLAAIKAGEGKCLTYKPLTEQDGERLDSLRGKDVQ